MRKKKPARRKKVSPRKKASARKKISPRKKLSPRKKTSGRRNSPPAKKAIRKKKKSRLQKPAREKRQMIRIVAIPEKGLGSDTGGQSGDIQGLSNVASADSESVQELAEEGQAYEAEVVSGVENAPEPDEAEVTTTEIPEDDIPPEYRNRERG